jgi:biotin carboxyl carrier protein
MKYYATVEGHTYEISIDHPDRVTVDGAELAVDMRLVTGAHLYSLLLENASFEVVIDTEADTRRNVYGVMVAGLRYLVKVQDERSRRLSLADRTLRAPEGELAIKAPIPGLVVKVYVVPGQAVAEGETMLILEAMKMENEVRAPRAGVVHELRIDAGAQVAMGQVLLMLK